MEAFIIMNEIWKPILIKGFEGLYEVSSFGRVRSLRNSKILKGSNSNGYRRIHLYNKVKIKSIDIHKLVAEAFIKNPKKKRYVNHIDLNKSNNNVKNLEWVTHQENIIHYFKTRKSIKKDKLIRKLREENKLLKVEIRKLKKTNQYG